MHVLLLSAGAAIAPRLASALEAAGHATSIVVDVADEAAVQNAAASAAAIIALGTASGPGAAATDRAVIATVARAIAASDRRFIYTSAAEVVGNTKGVVFDEHEEIDPGKLVTWRAENEIAARAAIANIVTIRPAPIVYGRETFGAFIGAIRAATRDERRAPYILHGNHRWSTVHADDLIDLYLRALDRAEASTTFFAASRELVTMRDCAQAIADAAGDDVETVSISLESGHMRFGVLADLSLLDIMVSGDHARESLDWLPSGRPLLAAIRDCVLDST